MTSIKKIDHIGIVTNNINKSLNFFENLFSATSYGFKKLEDRGIEIAFVDVGGLKIELMQPTREDSEISSFLRKKGTGIHHVAFSVNKLKDLVERLENNGVRFSSKKISVGACGHLVSFIHPSALNGVLIELVNYENQHN